MTLADDAWIAPAPGSPTRWELTHHILTVAYMRRGEDELGQRARPVLEQLRDETGESALLIVPDVRNFIVVDSTDSRQMLRTSVSIGLVVPANGSATGRCVVPYFEPERQAQLMGGRPDEALLEHFRLSCERGYSVSNEVVIEGVSHEGATTIAAPIFDAAGHPTGTVAITGPTDRLTPERQAEVGPMVAAAGRSLSRGRPRGTFF
ncbi:MAG: hypothetical protein EOP61_20110 [Sphingomonadales bacterium]|nr:MAG: hypothetical protein EOP61_20110 [Sphingomonadales bacterium]